MWLRTSPWYPVLPSLPCHLSTTAHPLTYGTLSHPQRYTYRALLPALLLQFSGAQPSPLTPVLAYYSTSRMLVPLHITGT